MKPYDFHASGRATTKIAVGGVLLPFVLILLGMAPATYADTAEYKWFVDLSLGKTVFETNRSVILGNYPQFGSDASIEGDATSLVINGGFNLDPLLSFQVGAPMLGEVVAKDSQSAKKLFDISGLTLETQVNWPTRGALHPFGEFGVFIWSMDENVDTSLGEGVDLTYGAGMDIDLYGGSERKLRVKWKRFEFDDVYVKSADLITMGLLFQF